MFGGTIGRPVGQKYSQKIYFLLIFVQSMCQKKIKKSLVAISKGYVWHNRAAGWAIAVTQFPATPLQPMHTKQFQTFFNCF